MKIVILLLVAVGAYGQISPPPTNAPSGAAGGNLSGTYPNPVVAKINGTTVTTNAAANQVPLTTAAAVTAWTGIPSCLDSVGQHLNFNTTTHAFSCGTTANAAPSSPVNSVQFNNAGAVGGDANLTWIPGFGSSTPSGLYIGGHETDIGRTSLSIFWPQPSLDAHFVSTAANDGRPYQEWGYYYWNSTTSVLQDLFYNGSQAVLSGANIADQSYFIESTPDYVAELAVRHSLLTVRSSTSICWNSADDAGLFTVPTPDTCIQRPAANTVKFTDGASGLASIQAGSYQESLHTPASSSEACTAGQFSDDDTYHYVCTAPNTWKRVALSSF